MIEFRVKVDERIGSVFNVIYEDTPLKMRLSDKTKIFQQVTEIAATNFGLEKDDKVFLMDAREDGCIYMK